MSEHFWTAKQTGKFIALDNKERAECQSFIFNIINEETKKPGSKENQLLHQITARVSIMVIKKGCNNFVDNYLVLL